MEGDLGASDVRAELVAGAAAGVAADRASAAGDQVELFEAPAGRALSADEARQEAVERRGRGRPVGSENLMTRDLRRWLLQRGVLPHQSMMEFSLLSPEEFSLRFSCTKLEAFDRLQKLWAELAPYFMPKLAPTDVSGVAVPPIALFVGGSHVNAGGAVPPWMRAFEAANGPEQNQALTLDAVATSKRDTSKGEE